MNPALVRNACDTFKIPVPERADTADKRADAARDALRAAEEIQRPNPASATAENIADLVDALIDFDTRHKLRVELLRDIARRAKSDAEAAWKSAASSLVDQFGEAFDRRAADFLKAIGDDSAAVLDPSRALAGERAKGHNAARSAAVDLSNLWQLRREISYVQQPANVWSTAIADLGLVLAIPDEYTLHRRIPAAADGTARGSAEWWAKVSAIPGVRIKWHNRDQLIEMAERCRVAKPAVSSYV